MNKAVLIAERIGKRYGNRTVLQDVSFQVGEGQTFGIIGPNGSGKSTLLKLLSGAERADAGSISLDGMPIERHPRKQLARWLAVLQQEALPPLGFHVREVVEMGRFPFQNWLGEDEAAADRIIDSILQRLELAGMERRPLDQLSGGERQRVALGKAMAQQPRLLMLDEPTTYLDIGHQIQFMDRIREWQRETGMTVVAVLHDLNLAAMYCDELLMIDRGRVVGTGTPRELLQPSLIERVYGVRPVLVDHPASGKPQLLLQSQDEYAGVTMRKGEAHEQTG